MTMKKAIGYDLDDILDLVGLQRRRSVIGSVLPAIGLVAIGAAVGAGIGLMLAPSSGRRLRQEVGDRFDRIRERVKSEAQKQNMIGAPAQQ
jgi:hypothetical protein